MRRPRGQAAQRGPALHTIASSFPSPPPQTLGIWVEIACWEWSLAHALPWSVSVCCLVEQQPTQPGLRSGVCWQLKSMDDCRPLLPPRSVCQGRHSKRSGVSFYGPLKDLAEHRNSSPWNSHLQLLAFQFLTASWTRWVTFCICICPPLLWLWWPGMFALKYFDQIREDTILLSQIKKVT